MKNSDSALMQAINDLANINDICAEFISQARKERNYRSYPHNSSWEDKTSEYSISPINMPIGYHCGL